MVSRFFCFNNSSTFVFKAASIKQLFTCADPLFSKYLIGFGKLVPLIIIGNFPEFVLNFAPNLVNGLTTLKKSLFERLCHLL